MVQKDNLNKKNSNKKIIIICGATASGKSDLAVECAKLLDTEIVSADSMYIYKNLNIGTAKPTQDEMQGIKHHMIDIVEPFESFSVSDYKKLAQPIVDDIINRGRIPIICGGTGFYINSILYDLSYGKSEGNAQLRDKYNNLAIQYGNQYVYNILKQKDSESAKKLHYNDLKRVIRALEIFDSGIKKSDIVDDLIPKYNYNAFSINHQREVLYDRINYRVDKMFSQGLVDEVKNLLAKGISKKHQCMQAIGYKEVLDFLDGNCTIEQAKENIKLNTRHYAKRQITFFKKLNAIKLEPISTKILAKQIVKEYKND